MTYTNQNQSKTIGSANDQIIPETSNEFQKSQNNSEINLDQEKSCWTFRMKVFIGVFVILLIFGLALGIGLGIGLNPTNKVSIEPVGQLKIFEVGNIFDNLNLNLGKLNLENLGVLSMRQYKLENTKLFSANTKANLILTQGIQNIIQNGLTSEASKVSNYKAHMTLEESGIQMTFASIKELKMGIDLEALLKYMTKQSHQIQNLVTEEGNITSWLAVNQDKITEEIKMAVAEGLKGIIAQNSMVIGKTKTVKFMLNSETNTYQAVSRGEGGQNVRRMLMGRRLDAFSEIRRLLNNLVSIQVRPSVEMINENWGLIKEEAAKFRQVASVSVSTADQAIDLANVAETSVMNLADGCYPLSTSEVQCDENVVTPSMKVGDQMNLNYGLVTINVQTDVFKNNGKILAVVGWIVGLIALLLMA